MHTDENHPATMLDILTYLEQEGISASRKTVIQDIEQLIESSVDVVRNTGHHHEFFIGERLFELPEIDAYAKIIFQASGAYRTNKRR